MQVSAFQLSVHHQNLFSFKQLLPWAGSAKSMNNLWTAFEIMSSSSRQGVDKNKQKVHLQSAATFQQVQWPIEQLKIGTWSEESEETYEFMYLNI